jgi:hypothetical protein
VWPPSFPDFKSLRLIIVGAGHSSVVNENNPHFFSELKGIVRREITDILRQELRHLLKNIFGMCEASFKAIVEQFEPIL